MENRLNFEMEIQYAAGTKCDKSVGNGNKDGVFGGYKVKKAVEWYCYDTGYWPRHIPF